MCGVSASDFTHKFTVKWTRVSALLRARLSHKGAVNLTASNSFTCVTAVFSNLTKRQTDSIEEQSKFTV